MLINGKQRTNIVLTFWDHGNVPRVMLIDEGEALVLEWDKKQAVSECYVTDPVKLEFKEVKGKKSPFVATYKTGEILKGMIHRDRFNEWEQKEYDKRMAKERARKNNLAEAEQQAKERAEKEQEQRETNRALIRLAGKGFGKGKTEKKNVSFSTNALKKVADFVRHDRVDFPKGRSYKKQFEEFKAIPLYYVSEVNTAILFKKAKDNARKTIDKGTGRYLIPAKKRKLRKKLGK